MSDVSHGAIHSATTPSGTQLTLAWTGALTPDDIRDFGHPEWLDVLIHHPSADMRLALAENPHAPILLLRWLRQDPDPRVRAAVAAHPHTGSAMLWQLAADRDVTVRLAVARNPDTPPSALVILGSDPEREIVLTVLRHPALPLDVLAKLTRHDDAIVRAAVARHVMATETMLLALAADPAAAVVMAVCLRPRLPDRVRAFVIETTEQALAGMVHAVQFRDDEADDGQPPV